MDRDNLPFYLMAIIGFVMMVLGFVGESLGWWHLFGEVISVGGLVATVLGLALPFVVGPSKIEVRKGFSTTGFQLDTTNAKLDTANGRLDAVSGKLDNLGTKADTTNDLLRQIRDRLGRDA